MSTQPSPGAWTSWGFRGTRGSCCCRDAFSDGRDSSHSYTRSPKIAGTFPDAHGVILGGALFGREEDFKEELHKEIGRLNLEKRLHLAGHHTIAPWLERSACVVHSSLAPDAFPNVCVEALAARRALITNTECGVAEILTGGTDAWVVPPRDVDALSAAIRDVLNDPARAVRVAESGYRQYAAHCTPSHMVRAIERELCALS